MLNAIFDAQAKAIGDHGGGEIFIGGSNKAAVPEQDRPAAQSTPAKDLGL
jgi:hypothetical protein